jgi:hypothetical protein
VLSCKHIKNSCEKNSDIQNHPGAKGLIFHEHYAIFVNHKQSREKNLMTLSLGYPPFVINDVKS